MADNSLPDEPFDWDDEDDDISLTFDEDVDSTWFLDEKLSRFGRIGMIIGAAHADDGADAIAQSLGVIEHLMKWRVEIVADGHALDDFLLSAYDVYDETAWWYYVNSDTYSQSAYDIVMLSKISMELFAKEFTNSPLTFKEKLRSALLRVVRRLS